MVFNFETHGNARPGDLSTARGPGLALSSLRAGETGRVLQVSMPGPIGTRLQELGFRAGVVVRLVRRAPLGDPAVYEVQGAQICLRAAEARAIRVRRIEP